MKKLFVVVFMFVCIGCATDQEIVKQQPTYKPTGIAPKPVILSPQQSGEIPPILSPGTKVTFRQGNVVTKQWVTLSWVVKDSIKWQGKNAYLIDMTGGQGQSFILWDTNLNLVATIDSHGKVLTAFEPCVKIFSFPLKVGNGYSYGYEYWSGGKKATVTEQVKVESKELISTPAGKYDVFVIKRNAPLMTERHFYSPHLGFPVRWEWSQAYEHPQGPGEFVVELIKFEK